MTLDIMPLMEDPYDLDLLLTPISEEDHVRGHGETSHPFSNLRASRPDFTGGFSEQLTLGSDSGNHLRCDAATRGSSNVGRDPGEIATRCQRKPNPSQAASDRRALRISSNTSSA